MSAPRGLSEDEAAAWERLAASVTPLPGMEAPSAKADAGGRASPPPPAKRAPKSPTKARAKPGAQTGEKPAAPATAKPPLPTPRASQASLRPATGGLDGHWDRRLKAGDVAPDFTLDLHGHGLDAAYQRLEDGLFQARAQDARLVLLIAGKLRPVDPADRGHRRGAIRAKILDWLAVGPHSDAIAAVRKAHRRHGGEGALYLVLRRRR